MIWNTVTGNETVTWKSSFVPPVDLKRTNAACFERLCSINSQQSKPIHSNFKIWGSEMNDFLSKCLFTTKNSVYWKNDMHLQVNSAWIWQTSKLKFSVEMLGKSYAKVGFQRLKHRQFLETESWFNQWHQDLLQTRLLVLPLSLV